MKQIEAPYLYSTKWNGRDLIIIIDFFTGTWGDWIVLSDKKEIEDTEVLNQIRDQFESNLHYDWIEAYHEYHSGE